MNLFKSSTSLLLEKFSAAPLPSRTGKTFTLFLSHTVIKPRRELLFPVGTRMELLADKAICERRKTIKDPTGRCSYGAIAFNFVVSPRG